MLQLLTLSLWTGGTADNSETALTVVNSTGDVTSIVNTDQKSISASDNIYVNSIDYSLDETKMVVDGISIVDESNWLTIDANHLGAEPQKEVGLVITSNEDYSLSQHLHSKIQW